MLHLVHLAHPNLNIYSVPEGSVVHIYARQEAPQISAEPPEKNSQAGNFPTEPPVIGKEPPVIGKEPPVTEKQAFVTRKQASVR